MSKWGILTSPWSGVRHGGITTTTGAWLVGGAIGERSVFSKIPQAQDLAYRYKAYRSVTPILGTPAFAGCAHEYRTGSSFNREGAVRHGDHGLPAPTPRLVYHCDPIGEVARAQKTHYV